MGSPKTVLTTTATSLNPNLPPTSPQHPPIPPTSPQHPPNIPPTSPQHPRNIPPTSPQHPPNIPPTSPQHPPNIHPTSTQHPPNIHPQTPPRDFLFVGTSPQPPLTKTTRPRGPAAPSGSWPRSCRTAHPSRPEANRSGPDRVAWSSPGRRRINVLLAFL